MSAYISVQNNYVILIYSKLSLIVIHNMFILGYIFLLKSECFK